MCVHLIGGAWLRVCEGVGPTHQQVSKVQQLYHM